MPPFEPNAKSGSEFIDDDFIGQFGRTNRIGKKTFLSVRLHGNLNERMGRSENRGQPFEHSPRPLVHGQAEDLGRDHVAVTVDDQSWQAISLGMDDAVCVSEFVKVQHLPPQVHSAQQSVLPVFGAGSGHAEVEHPQDNFRPWIEQGVSEQLSLRRVDGDKIACARLPINVADELAKHVRMPAHRAEFYDRERSPGGIVKRPLFEKTCRSQPCA
jgi:hypothetical protein